MCILKNNIKTGGNKGDVYNNLTIMDTSTNHNDTEQSFRSPPRRRRSTFFERRDSLLPQPLSENIDPNSCKQTIENNEKYYQDLRNYYEKLLAEKEQWKKEVNSRRNKYHDLRQQYQMAMKAPSRSRMSYAALSNDDIAFLKGKVNLTKLVESQLKLHKSVKQTVALHRRAIELDNVILNDCEEKVNEIIQYVLDNSTVE